MYCMSVPLWITPGNVLQNHFQNTIKDHVMPLLDFASSHVFWITFQKKAAGVAAVCGKLHAGYLPLCCDVLPRLINPGQCGKVGQMPLQSEQLPANQKVPSTASF